MQASSNIRLFTTMTVDKDLNRATHKGDKNKYTLYEKEGLLHLKKGRTPAGRSFQGTLNHINVCLCSVTFDYEFVLEN